jgi:hypothetical protein
MDPAGKWHFIGRNAGNGAASSNRLWTCNGCNSSNHSKNACGTCGMRRSWADVVKNNPDTQQQQQPKPPQLPSQNKVDKQLAEVAEKLKQAKAGRQQQQQPQQHPGGANNRVPPAAPQPNAWTKPHAPTAFDAPSVEESTSKPKLVAAIKALESALASIPEGQGNDEVRTRLLEDIEEKKSQLPDTRPLGKRLDASKAYLERCQRRKEAADEAVALALAAQKHAVAELDEAASQVDSLQSQLSSSSSSTTMEDLEIQLNAAVASLEQSDSVAPEIVAQARQEALALLSAFKSTLIQAKMVDEGGRPRLNGKLHIPAPLVSGNPVRRVRGPTPAAEVPMKQQNYVANHFSQSKRHCTFSRDALEGEEPPECELIDDSEMKKDEDLA